jgi:hypothetical protein
VPKFSAQKPFSGPPVFSAIPDDPDVNLKRQTFVPNQPTLPKNRLPVISTPKTTSGS